MREPLLRDLRTEALAELILERARRPIRRLLVVGCGSGKEAAILARVLHAECTGIDLLEQFDPGAAARVDLRRGDATCLDFADRSFDFVYSYHALEHIPQHVKALREMHRVLADDGGYCVGTPNRLRLVGYFGSPDTPPREKLRWNMIDWKARLQGRFRNELERMPAFRPRSWRATCKKRSVPPKTSPCPITCGCIAVTMPSAGCWTNPDLAR